MHRVSILKKSNRISPRNRVTYLDPVFHKITGKVGKYSPALPSPPLNPSDATAYLNHYLLNTQKKMHFTSLFYLLHFYFHI